MNKNWNLLAVACLIVLGSVVSTGRLGGQTIGAAQAKNHLGETATVCGKVVSAHYAASSRGRPTFLNLDEPYPHQVFTIVIWGADRAKFDKPEETDEGKSICVTGRIKDYRGVPEVVASEPSQIKSQSK